MYLFIESQYLESYQFGNHIPLTKTVFIKDFFDKRSNLYELG